MKPEQYDEMQTCKILVPFRPEVLAKVLEYMEKAPQDDLTDEATTTLIKAGVKFFIDFCESKK